jgi:myo-inositol 2-dehydrogenase / D-chiro-inositol 1-dehydrogenase
VAAPASPRIAGISFGVGFLGAGPVTQAIHLPVLATMAARFHVVRVMDVNARVAEGVASRCGATGTVVAEQVLTDPAVDVVAVCSPNQFHAEQVIAACRAGKRLVLCEKPLATSVEEAERIRAVATETRTTIVVGTMHAYDPAYRAARDAWRDAGEDGAPLVASSIYLPMNEVFIDQATDPFEAPLAPPRGPLDPADPAFQKMMLRGAIFGLAIHDIPLIREFHRDVGKVMSARYLPIFGYAIALDGNDGAALLNASLPGPPRPNWTLRASGSAHELKVTFPPSYVLSGSARAELAGRSEARVFEQPVSGYEAMWDHVADVLDGSASPLVPLDTLIADLAFAAELAASCEAFIESQR